MLLLLPCFLHQMEMTKLVRGMGKRVCVVPPGRLNCHSAWVQVGALLRSGTPLNTHSAGLQGNLLRETHIPACHPAWRNTKQCAGHVSLVSQLTARSHGHVMGSW